MVFFVDWAGWYVFLFFSLFFLSPSLFPSKLSSYLDIVLHWIENLTDYLMIFHFFGNRIEFNGTHHKLFGIFIYSVGGMVGGWKGDFER